MTKPELIEIDDENWRFTIYETVENKWLGDFDYSPISVVDTSMLIELTDEEKKAAQESREFLINLSEDIRNNFKEYEKRGLSREHFHFLDVNDLLDHFSFSMGNRQDEFSIHAESKGISNETIKSLISKFQNTQHDIYSHLYKITEPDIQLSSEEIEIESEKFCSSNMKWLRSKGILAINRWLIWMCWHEGILKK